MLSMTSSLSSVYKRSCSSRTAVVKASQIMMASNSPKLAHECDSSVTWSKRRLRPRTQKTSVTSSDRGYSSALSLPIASSSTLDVFRPRTLTGTSSNGSSSSYHTPQGSVYNDPSPTSSGGAMLPFSEGTVDTMALQMQMLECISEKLDRLVERVGRLEASVSEGLGGGERAGEKLVVDSLPDLTEPEVCATYIGHV